MTSQQPDFDLAVVGGGLAGASLACAVADTGLSVALVEAVAFDAEPDAAMQARTTAIAWGTRVMFEQLGLWAAMAPGGAAIERLHVSQRGHFGVVRVQAADYDLPALGYVLSHTAMVAALRARLAQFQHVTVIAPARFVALEHAGQCVHLQLESDGGSRRISTRLVVGADGANSSVRQALGIGARIDDYAQSALVTTLRTEYAHDNVAYERFTPDGPVAILPRSHDSCAAVWTLPTAQAEAVCAASENEFNRRLQQAFGHRLGRLQLAGPRGTFPLQRVLAHTAAGKRALLMGNAGHALHPAAAQGFNLSIRDALVLAAMLRVRVAHKGFDPGAPELLAAWAQARRPDQHRVANFTDAIVRLFSNRIPGLNVARAAGLVGLSLLPALRDDMARRSMGMAIVPQFSGRRQVQQ
ncbi:MAG TPA: 2-octaprenyl-6-methoxyphenyl hydroxylase [Salinisphaeraceae bacterium]|nr:2-octaprenyl-6-methoxyphenyl hydroxylase [Salinisphaeraceae bacterium]